MCSGHLFARKQCFENVDFEISDNKWTNICKVCKNGWEEHEESFSHMNWDL